MTAAVFVTLVAVVAALHVSCVRAAERARRNHHYTDHLKELP